MEIPTLSEKERQRMNSEMLVGNDACVIGFDMQKLGPQGVKEYNEWVANLSASAFREMGKDDPMGFAMLQAISWENQFGSDVDVVSITDGSVILNIKDCAFKKAAVECEKDGGPIKKDQQCNNCINLLGLIAKKL